MKLLSPTDCMKDRLAAYYHWNDRQSLEQALLVGWDKPFDLEELRRWSNREQNAKKFKVFRMRLKTKKLSNKRGPRVNRAVRRPG